METSSISSSISCIRSSLVSLSHTLKWDVKWMKCCRALSTGNFYCQSTLKFFFSSSSVFFFISSSCTCSFIQWNELETIAKNQLIFLSSSCTWAVMRNLYVVFNFFINTLEREIKWQKCRLAGCYGFVSSCFFVFYYCYFFW